MLHLSANCFPSSISCISYGMSQSQIQVKPIQKILRKFHSKKSSDLHGIPGISLSENMLSNLTQILIYHKRTHFFKPLTIAKYFLTAGNESNITRSKRSTVISPYPSPDTNTQTRVTSWWQKYYKHHVEACSLHLIFLNYFIKYSTELYFPLPPPYIPQLFKESLSHSDIFINEGWWLNVHPWVQLLSKSLRIYH